MRSGRVNPRARLAVLTKSIARVSSAIEPSVEMSSGVSPALQTPALTESQKDV